MKKELLNGLTEEQIAKVKTCKNQEELLKIAKEEGIELTDEQLNAVSGGGFNCSPSVSCPKCGSNDVDEEYISSLTRVYYRCTCKKCGHKFDS